MLLSLIIPTHDIPERGMFLQRLLDSIDVQSYRDFEIILCNTHKSMATNLNFGMSQARGEWVKIMCMDDAFRHTDSLKNLMDNVSGERWVIQATTMSTQPTWTNNILTGNNQLGPLSALAMRRPYMLTYPLFNELRWIVDIDLYWRLNKICPPKIISSLDIYIGTGEHQETFKISEDEKSREITYLRRTYEV